MGCALAAIDNAGALQLEEPTLYAATMASFGVAWAAFVAELVVFKWCSRLFTLGERCHP
jgi:hypothetical protein